MSETAEAAFDVQAWLQRYKGEIPQGSAGDDLIRERLAIRFQDTTEEDVRRDRLTATEINSWLDYAGWNLWDFILGRASEGESGLIPRQEYETVSFVQQWSQYPRFIRELTEEIGVDALIDLAGTARREVGTKINITRNWAASVCPILGRGISIDLGTDTVDDRREDLETLIQFGRRLQHGTWGDGPGFVSARHFDCAALDDDVFSSLAAQVRSLEDPERLKTFRRFNATTELFGFMLHYDCRAGMADTGPYPLPDGRFAIVRDHFLNETAYPWSGIAEGLPYAISQVMVFPADKVSITINDIQTTFSTPSNYLEFIEGAAVFARDTSDTPMSRLRVLDDEEMARIAATCQKQTIAMYKMLAGKSREEKIRDGIMVYNREFLMPHATRAGVWDRFVAEGFDTLSGAAEAAWPVLTSGKAAEVLTPVLLFGKGFPPVS
jgi:hypothetical protein